MVMEDLQLSFSTASRHFDNGQTKDAYHLYLTTAQNAIRPLFDIKFIHSSIVSKPQHYDTLLCMLRNCVDEVERIVEYHSISTRKAPPPPLPPKPSTSNKPVLSPKRIRPLPIALSLTHDSEETALAHVPNGEIDPHNLVLAQTNNNDSLIPSTNVSNTPYIPVPPLITTHKVLQAKLDELELSLNEYRAQKRSIQQGIENSHMTKSEIDDAISKYTPYVAEAKQTLNRIRTVHMTAATIPSILHFRPGVVAYQITRIESAIFSAIPSQALLTHSPKEPHPRIIASTDFFNFITRVIEHSIILPQEASSRAQHIHHWIKIAIKCQELNNYQTLKAIVSALGTPPVQRLKRTWGYVPKKSLSRLDTLNELMSESNNYEKYREHMGLITSDGKNKIQSEHAKRPTVPFLGTFIHDMTYLLAAVQHQSPLVKQNLSGLSRIEILQADARVQRLLNTLKLFQSCPSYDKKPNNIYAKTVQKTVSPVRPTFSQALYRSKSSFGKLGGAMGFGNGHLENTSETSLLGGEDDLDVEEQSNLVTQYILMRPWVSQNTVDELSLLREPPRTSSKQNTNGVARSNSVGSHYASSLISNTSSFMRLSASCNSTTTNASLSTLESRPDSFDDVIKLSERDSKVVDLAEINVHNDQISTRASHQFMRNYGWDHEALLYNDRVPIIPPRPKILVHKKTSEINNY
ncbi:hypothetical protein G6F62_004855 [Rhizopus arrhizus]|nr:hypothetical protein G6F62_004855 [Rhizopus arrhizus]